MKKVLLPVLILFLIVNTLTLVFGKQLQANNINHLVVLVGNMVLFLATITSAWLQAKAMQAQKSTGILKNVYGSFLAKFAIILIPFILYVLLAKPINKYGIYACLGLYLLYALLSIKTALKISKK
jgi:hypothetical protein